MIIQIYLEPKPKQFKFNENLTFQIFRKYKNKYLLLSSRINL